MVTTTVAIKRIQSKKKREKRTHKEKDSQNGQLNQWQNSGTANGMKKESGLEFVYAFKQQKNVAKTMLEMHENKEQKEYFGLTSIFVGFISLLMDNGFNLKEFLF